MKRNEPVKLAGLFCAALFLASAFMVNAADAAGTDRDSHEPEAGARYTASGVNVAKRATTLYADAINGSDLTGDGTQGNPYKSLSAAVAASSGGDVVMLMPGTYSVATTNESFPIAVPSLTIIGSGAGNTIIRGTSDWTIDINNDDWFLNCQSAGSNIFQAMTFANAGDGAVYSFDTDLDISDCVFDTCYGGKDGGAILAEDGDYTAVLEVSDCVFRNNGCGSEGGAIYSWFMEEATLTGNSFLDNYAYQYGGAVYLDGGTSTVAGNVFNGNWTDDGDGALCVDGIYEGARGYIYNNLFVNNVCYTYGIFDSYYASCNVYNNTFYGNRILAGGSEDHDPGIVYYEASSGYIYNNIVWGNTGDDFSMNESQLYIGYNDLEDGAAGLDDFSSDPLFVDAANGKFFLRAGSPCIDAGSNWDEAVGPADDLAGMARPASPDPVAVGAYEYYEAPVFNPMSDGRPINLTESQAITTNPYTILVYPTGAAGINRVEFFIDGILIGVDYEPDANGLYSCDWNTELYHSLVRVVAFDNQGQAVELSRNATVMLEMPFTGK